MWGLACETEAAHFCVALYYMKNDLASSLSVKYISFIIPLPSTIISSKVILTSL